MSVAAKLAEFFVETSFDDLQPEVVEHAKIAIANTLASAAAGSRKESVNMIRRQVRERAGAAESTVWFDSGPKTYVSDAARLNAMMSDAAAMDEFGESVAVDGDTVVVSAWLNDENGDNSGSIYVFTRSVGVWTERLKLLASDGQAEDHLGYFRPGLQLSGSTVVAGAPQDTTPGEPGAAYVFDVSVVNAVPIGGNSSGGSVGLLTVLLLFLCRRRMA